MVIKWLPRQPLNIYILSLLTSLPPYSLYLLTPPLHFLYLSLLTLPPHPSSTLSLSFLTRFTSTSKHYVSSLLRSLTLILFLSIFPSPRPLDYPFPLWHSLFCPSGISPVSLSPFLLYPLLSSFYSCPLSHSIIHSRGRKNIWGTSLYYSIPLLNCDPFFPLLYFPNSISFTITGFHDILRSFLSLHVLILLLLFLLFLLRLHLIRLPIPSLIPPLSLLPPTFSSRVTGGINLPLSSFLPQIHLSFVLSRPPTAPSSHLSLLSILPFHFTVSLTHDSTLIQLFIFSPSSTFIQPASISLFFSLLYSPTYVTSLSTLHPSPSHLQLLFLFFCKTRLTM